MKFQTFFTSLAAFALFVSLSGEAGTLIRLPSVSGDPCETLLEQPSPAKVLPIRAALPIRERKQAIATIARVERRTGKERTAEQLGLEQADLLAIARGSHETGVRVAAIRALGESLFHDGHGAQFQMPFIELTLRIAHSKTEAPAIIKAAADALAESIVGPGFTHEEVVEVIECLRDRKLTGPFRAQLLVRSVELVRADKGAGSKMALYLLEDVSWTLAADGRENSSVRLVAARVLGRDTPAEIRALDRSFKALLKPFQSMRTSALVRAVRKADRLALTDLQAADFVEILEAILARPRLPEVARRAILESLEHIAFDRSNEEAVKTWASDLLSIALTNVSESSAVFRAAQQRAAQRVLEHSSNENALRAIAENPNFSVELRRAATAKIAGSAAY